MTCGDLAVFDRLELVGGDLAALVLAPRFFQRRGAQQAADMIGAEGGRVRELMRLNHLIPFVRAQVGTQFVS